VGQRLLRQRQVTLVRVLEYLWCDVALPEATEPARSRPYPTRVRDHLTELSTAGKRFGGLWSAAGHSGIWQERRRASWLSCRSCFESAGLPGEYSRARFYDLGSEERLPRDRFGCRRRRNAARSGKEIHDLYVSPVIAKALPKPTQPSGPSIQGDVRSLAQDAVPPTTRDVQADQELFDVRDDVSYPSVDDAR